MSHHIAIQSTCVGREKLNAVVRRLANENTEDFLVNSLIDEHGEVSFGGATTYPVALGNFDPASTDERVVFTYFGRELEAVEIAQELIGLRDELESMRHMGFHVGLEFNQAECAKPFYWSITWPFDDSTADDQAFLEIYNFNNVDSELNAPIEFSVEVVGRVVREIGHRFGFDSGQLVVDDPFIEYRASCNRIRCNYGAGKDPRNGATLRFFFDPRDFGAVVEALDIVWREIDQTCTLSFGDAPLLEEYNRWPEHWPNLAGAYLLLVNGIVKEAALQQYRVMSPELHGFLPLFRVRPIENGRKKGIVTVSADFQDERGYLFLSAHTDTTTYSQMTKFIKDAGIEELFAKGAVVAT